MSKKQQVLILDTTLRDGEQTPGINLNLTEKLAIARQLEKMGVDVIEAGFPAASPGDFEAVRAVSQTVSCGVAGLCRCVPEDLETCKQALKYAKKPRVHVFIATSPIHMQYKLCMEPEEVLRDAVSAVQSARSFCDDVEFSCEDASRSDPEFLYRIIAEVLKAGATTINIPDTVGYAIPNEYAALMRGILEHVPEMAKATLSAHCHNDLGLAVANTLAALSAGVRQVECTVNALGERAGNCSLEEVAMAISIRGEQLNLTHNLDTTRIYRTSRRVSKLTGVPISVNKAIVGANAFAHESGIHQHGVLANPMCYEIMTPQSVGKPESKMVLGKLSGRHAFDDRLRALGYELNSLEMEEAFRRFKELCDRKKQITDDDLEALVAGKEAAVPEFYRLDSFQIQSGNRMRAMANVTLLHEGESFTEAALGDGPVDAAYNAAARIVGGDWPLASYDIRAVTEGEDALGEVTVRVRRGKRLYTGRGLATDIIEASIRAYINAINRVFAEEAKL